MRVTLLFVLMLSLRLNAIEYIAASCDLTNVQAAVDAAGVGDIVTIPVGSATWTNQLLIDRKNVFLRGSGSYGTRITSTYAVNDYLILINALTNQFFSVSNIYFVCGPTEFTTIGIRPKTASGATINTWSTPVWVRLSGLTFTNLSRRGIVTEGAVFGLIDHCVFNVPTSATGISPDSTSASDICSSNSWNRVYSFGTTNQLVIEDCNFNWQTTYGNGWIDSYGGTAWTLRYCSGTNGNIGAHGTDSGGSKRGTLAAEVYKNQIYVNINLSSYQFRGGSIQIFSNSIYTSGTAVANTGQTIWNQYRNTGTNVYGGGVACCTPYGAVSITNHWDGCSDQYGYPGLDQLGRLGPTTFGATNSTQVLAPCYIWGNTVNGTNDNRAAVGNDNVNLGDFSYIARPGLMVQINRDWYEGIAMPGYTPLVYPHPLQNYQPPTPVEPPKMVVNNLYLR